MTNYKFGTGRKIVAIVSAVLLATAFATPAQSAGVKYSVYQKTLATFSETATTLTSQQRAQVKAAVDANPTAEKFICTGIRYYSQPMSINIMVRKRAKAACEYAKQLNPELSTWFQNKPTQAKSYAGKVLLTLKKPLVTSYTGISYADGITSAEVVGWVEAAIAEMEKPPSTYMGMIWPIGRALDDEPDPGVFGGDPFYEYSDVLSAAEITEASNYFRTWQTSAAAKGCEQSAAELSEGADRVERWIRGAANVATAPDPCFDARASTVAWSAEQSKYTAKTTFFHESYHGMSNYLLSRCSPILRVEEDQMNQLRWFAEGTADYFGHYMAAKDEGRTDHKQRLLARLATSLVSEPNMTLDSNTYPQAAAMILMMERGLITEEKLVDGSYFHDCNWISTFDPERNDIKYIFENFSKIESSGGIYSYTEQAING